MTILSPLQTKHLAGLAALWVGLSMVAILMWSLSLGVEPDGVTYLDAARSLAEGHGFQHRWAYWDPIYTEGRVPTPTSMWPPGLPSLIALGIWTGADAVTTGRVVGLTSFMLLPLGLFLIARWIVHPGGAVLAAAVASTMWPVIADAGQVKTELPFLALGSFVVVLCGRALRSSGSAWLWWMAASAAAGGTFLLRYVGLASVAVVSGLIVWCAVRAPRPERLKLAASLLPGVVCVALVMGRNWWVSGTPGQPWPGSDIFWTTLPSSFISAVNEVLGAGPLPDSLGWLRLVSAVALGGLFLTALYAVLQTVRSTRADVEGLTASGITAALFVSVLALTVGATALNGMNLESRYATILTPWALLLCAAWALRAPTAPDEPHRWRLAHALCVLWLVVQLPVIGYGIVERRASPNYIESGADHPAMRWLRASVPPTELVLTNRGADVAFWCPNPVMRLPRRPHSAYGSLSWQDVDELASKTRARYLVHFRQFPTDAKYDAAEFEFLRSLDDPGAQRGRVIEEFPDVVIYRVGTASGSSALRQ